MILDIICSIFDIALWKLFYDGILKNRKTDIPYFLHIASYILSEAVLLVFSVLLSTNYSDYRILFNTILSFALSFVLTFLYDCRFSHRFFVSMCFSVLSLLSEIFVYQIIMLFPKNIAQSFLADQTYGAISAKLISLLFCTLIIRFFRRKENLYNVQYTALIFIMPTISLVMLMTIPIRSDLTKLEIRLSMIDLAGLLLANIVNYYLLDNILRVQQLKQRESQLNQQVNVQLDKYQQISQAYRSSRSFIHDIKKQYFYIQECLNKHKYDEIEIFLTDALQELEQTAAKVNTGNLVIDSFVSTHMALAEQEGIQFQTRLQIELEKIPLNDYDLCLILGNLLDNSYQECHKIPNSFFRQIRIEIYTSQLDMLIHVANTVNETEYLLKKENNNALYHGYGTANIERITKKYQGTYTNSIENGFYHAIVSIPYISK